MTGAVVVGRKERACDACKAPIHARVRYIRLQGLTAWRSFPHGVRFTGHLCVRCATRDPSPLLRALTEEIRRCA